MGTHETKPVPPYVPIAHANRALSAAREARAEALLSITSEILKPVEVIDLAADEEGRPLMNLSLHQILIAQKGWGPQRSKECLAKLCAVLEMPVEDTTKLTVSWLLDSKSGGRRFTAWVDVLEIRTKKIQAPWPGFPFTPSPAVLAQNKGK